MIKRTPLKEGLRVVVHARKHPHEGKHGVICEIIGRYLPPIRVLVTLDDGSGIAVVSPEYLLAEIDAVGKIPMPVFVRRVDE